MIQAFEWYDASDHLIGVCVIQAFKWYDASDHLIGVCIDTSRQRGGAGVVGEHLPVGLDQVYDAERSRGLSSFKQIHSCLGGSYTRQAWNRSALLSIPPPLLSFPNYLCKIR